MKTRKDIIDLLENKIKYDGLRLPSYIDFNINNRILLISLGKRNSKNGVIYSCCVNMQSDEAAFEGWSICLKHHLSKYIDFVVLSWEKPIQMTGNQQLHYNRFAYRVIRFKQMYKWFDIAAVNKNELTEFEKTMKDLVINTPLKEASETSDASSKEKQIEYNPHNLDFIKDYFKLHYINHQLPVGVKKNNRNFFTGRSSAIDIWGIDNQSNLNIYELKLNNNYKVGIISELLFYSEVMHDLFITKQINPPSKIRKIRNSELLYGNSAITIKAIKSHFLFDKLHPMVVGTTALINSNNFGLKFFNAQYKLTPGTFDINKVYYKGAFQMEEEIKQTSCRTKNKLAGNKYILRNCDENLHESIRHEAKLYFKENEIAWWKYGDNSDRNPTNHMVSSQIQCLNYLFALIKDKVSMIKLAQLFDPEIDDVLPSIGDKDSGYIAFEFIYDNATLLGENDTNANRGEYCTSIDAFVIGLKQGKKILIPIEWKYTEEYQTCENKALEPRRGETRQNRYNKLIAKSDQLKTPESFEESVFYYEPFYELMRQTLLVEQMVKIGIANDFLHILVVPSENKDLLDNNYTFTNNDLQTTWLDSLSDQSKFRIIDSRQILHLIENLIGYSKLATYLKSRY